MTTQSHQPMLWAALAYGGGIWAGAHCWRPATWWLTAAAVLLIAAAYWVRPRIWLAAPAALAAMAALGAIGLQLHNASRDWVDLGTLADGHPVTVLAHVTRDGVLRPGAYGGEQESVEAESEAIADPGVPQAPPRRVYAGMRLAIYSHAKHQAIAAASLPLLHYGQRIRVTAQLRPPRNFGNPGAWDQKSYLARQGIFAVGSATAEDVEVLPGFAGTRFEALRSRIRRSVLAHFRALWRPADALLICAMLIGEQTLVDRDTRVAFQRTGVYHILVVSGMNVGILAFVLFWSLRRLRQGELVSTLVTLVATGAYTCLTDLGAPILRATFMLWIYLGARLLYRDRHALNPVGTAAMALLVIDPGALFDPSFQLTFLCVLAIAGIAVPLLERSAGRYRRALAHLESVDYDLRLDPRMAQFRLDLRLIGDRLAKILRGHRLEWLLVNIGSALIGVYEVLQVAALMQLVMVLPMAAYFHRAALLTVPANTVVVPLTGALMPAALIATGLSYLSPLAAWIPAELTSITLHGITGTIRLLAGLRVVDMRVPTPATAAMIAAAGAFALALILARCRPYLVAAGLVSLAGTAIWLAAVPPSPQLSPGKLEVTALDVGQGDSLLVVTPGGKTLLVDSGGTTGLPTSAFDVGEDVVSPYLWSRGIRRLDAAVITHAHADHMGGMRSVIANFKPRELWLSHLALDTETAELTTMAGREGVTVRRFSAPARFEFGGTAVEVLSPPEDWKAGSAPRNNDSLVLKFLFAGRSALLEGDAEKKVERRLAADWVRADLLKVGHHGSANATSAEFLASVQPSFAVISAGFRNRFHYPRPEVLARLDGARVATYRTDLNGAITFYLGEDGVSARLPNRQ
jgi:competence protein ComEC